MKHLTFLIALMVLFGACAAEPTQPSYDEKRPPAPPPGPTCSASVDLTSDPLNCGTCGTACASGLCYSGVCADAVAGHVLVIGHGYDTSNPALDRVLGNAVFFNDRPTIRVLAFAGFSPDALVTGANAAIDREAARRGRTTTKTVTTNSADIQVLIGSADVFLVYAQTLADSLSLYYLGDEWSIPIDNFGRSGGVIVVLDAPSSNLGTPEVLRRPGLMDLAGRAPAAGTSTYLADPSDAFAARVPMIFSSPGSVSWPSSTTAQTVATDEGGMSDVFHRPIY